MNRPSPLRALMALLAHLRPRLVFPPPPAHSPATAITPPLDGVQPEHEHEHEPSLPRFTATSMARALGLSLDASAHTLTRQGHTLALSPELTFDDLDHLEARQAFTIELLAARLAMDTRAASWTPDLERPPAPEKAHQKHEIPSSYGDRVPWIVPHEARLRCEAWLHEPLFAHRFDAARDVIYVLEIGRHAHALTLAQAEQLDLSAARLQDDARYTLFYASYKLSPERHALPFAEARHYATTEGLGAARALLLPDFDLDAARLGGVAAIVSRDLLVVFEPPAALTEAARPDFEARCEAYAHTLRHAEKFPYAGPLLRLATPS